MGFQSFHCWCQYRVTELGDLSSVSEVGVGLFLGLAIVQVLGSGGLARLRRSATHLRDMVRTNRIGTERASVARIEANLLRLELQLEGLSRLFLRVSFALIIASVAGVGVVSLFGDYALGCTGTGLFIFFYLVLPVLAFLAASWVIRRKCRSVEDEISTARIRIIGKL